MVLLYSKYGYEHSLKDNICRELDLKLGTYDINLSRLRATWYAFEFLDSFSEYLLAKSKMNFRNFKTIISLQSLSCRKCGMLWWRV